MVKNRPQRKITGVTAKSKCGSKVGGMNVKSKGGGGSPLFPMLDDPHRKGQSSPPAMA